jgi:TP901 family phage tail tape measure protein
VAISVGEIEATLRLRDEMTAQLRSAVGQLAGAGVRLQSIGSSMQSSGAMLTAALTVPLVGAAIQIVKTGVEFEKTMNTISGVTQSSTDDMDKFREKAMEMGAATVFSANDAATALLELSKAGFTTEEALGAIDKVLELAAASGMSMGEAAEMSARTIRAFGLEVTDLGHVNDVLAKAVNASTLEVTDLQTAFRYVGPIARGLGMDIETTTAAIGLMRDNGIAAETAGRGLREGLTRLLNPTLAVRQVMAELGIDTFKSGGKLMQLGDIVETLRTRGADTAQIMKLFGDAAGPGMEALVRMGGAALADFTQMLRDSEGAAKAMADAAMKGLPGALEETKGAIETASLSISKALEPALLLVLGAVRALATFVTAVLVPAFTAWPVPVQAVVIGLVALAAVVGPLLAMLGTMLTLVGSGMNAFRSLAGGVAQTGAAATVATGQMLALTAATTQAAAAQKAFQFSGAMTSDKTFKSVVGGMSASGQAAAAGGLLRTSDQAASQAMVAGMSSVAVATNTATAATVRMSLAQRVAAADAAILARGTAFLATATGGLTVATGTSTAAQSIAAFGSRALAAAKAFLGSVVLATSLNFNVLTARLGLTAAATATAAASTRVMATVTSAAGMAAGVAAGGYTILRTVFSALLGPIGLIIGALYTLNQYLSGSDSYMKWIATSDNVLAQFTRWKYGAKQLTEAEAAHAIAVKNSTGAMTDRVAAMRDQLKAGLLDAKAMGQIYNQLIEEQKADALLPGNTDPTLPGKVGTGGKRQAEIAVQMRNLAQQAKVLKDQGIELAPGLSSLVTQMERVAGAAAPAAGGFNAMSEEAKAAAERIKELRSEMLGLNLVGEAKDAVKALGGNLEPTRKGDWAGKAKAEQDQINRALASVSQMSDAQQADLNKQMTEAMDAARRNKQEIPHTWIAIELATRRAFRATDEYINKFKQIDSSTLESLVVGAGGRLEVPLSLTLDNERLFRDAALAADKFDPFAKGSILDTSELMAGIEHASKLYEYEAEMARGVAAATRDNEVAANAWRESLGAVAQMFEQIGQNASGAIGGIARAAGAISGAFAAGGSGPVMTGLKQMMSGGAKNAITGGLGVMGGFMGAIGSVGAIEQARTTGSKGDRIANTMAAGAQAGMAFGPWGAAIGAGWGALVGALSSPAEQARKLARSWSKDMVAEFELVATAEMRAAAGGNAIRKMQQMTIKAYQELGLTAADAMRDLDAVHDASAVSAEAVARAIEHINKQLERQQELRDANKQKQEMLNAAVERYGFTFEQAGKAFQKGNLAKRAEELLQDYKLLTEGGMDHTVALTGMSKAFSAFVNDAAKAGVDVPESMRPILQALIDSRLLTDSAGGAFKTLEQTGLTFGKELEGMFERVLEKLEALILAITGDAAKAAGIDPTHFRDMSITSTPTGQVAVPRGTGGYTGAVESGTFGTPTGIVDQMVAQTAVPTSTATMLPQPTGTILMENVQIVASDPQTLVDQLETIVRRNTDGVTTTLADEVRKRYQP